MLPKPVFLDFYCYKISHYSKSLVLTVDDLSLVMIYQSLVENAIAQL